MNNEPKDAGYYWHQSKLGNDYAPEMVIEVRELGGILFGARCGSKDIMPITAFNKQDRWQKVVNPEWHPE